MSLQLSPDRMAELKAGVLFDLDQLDFLVEDYRRVIQGRPGQFGLQDIELLVRNIRERIEKAKEAQAAEHRFGKQVEAKDVQPLADERAGAEPVRRAPEPGGGLER